MMLAAARDPDLLSMRGRPAAAVGTREGPFRILYRFENEQRLELINRIVHAAALSALVETAHAYRFSTRRCIGLVIWATTRTQVDRVSRIVALEDFKVTKSNFPTLPEQGASYVAALQANMAPSERTIALDRLEASLAASGAAKPATFPVNNDPPRIIVSQTPAILITIDGPPMLQSVLGSQVTYTNPR